MRKREENGGEEKRRKREVGENQIFFFSLKCAYSLVTYHAYEKFYFPIWTKLSIEAKCNKKDNSKCNMLDFEIQKIKCKNHCNLKDLV